MLRRTVVAIAAVALLIMLQATSAMPSTLQGAPPQGAQGPYVIYINWDAFRDDYFDWAIAAAPDRLPHLSRFVAEGVRFLNAYTGIPSITTAMQATALTGAWPDVHSNIGIHYEPNANLVRSSGRRLKADTIVDAAHWAGLITLSVQQFMLDGSAGTYLQPGGRFERRVAEALKVFEAGLAGRRPMPQFISIYADDLDAAGHNGLGYGTVPSLSEEAWRRKMVSELVRMDKALGTLFARLKKLGMSESTAVILTSDHGMTPYWGETRLPDIVSEFAKAGLEAVFVESGEKAPSYADVVLTTNGTALQVYFIAEVDPGAVAALQNSIGRQPYVEGVLSRTELAALGAHALSGDMLIWANPPNHFAAHGVYYGIRANHDTRHPSSAHVFMAMGGAGINQGVEVSAPTPIIDVAPTISQLLGIDAPLNSSGKILWEALSTSAEAPRLPADSTEGE